MSTTSPIAEEWQQLCEQHRAARDAYLEAFARVNSRFASVGAGQSTVNPTRDELANFEVTWNAWRQVKEHMDAFVKKHA